MVPSPCCVRIASLCNGDCEIPKARPIGGTARGGYSRIFATAGARCLFAAVCFVRRQPAHGGRCLLVEPRDARRIASRGPTAAREFTRLSRVRYLCASHDSRAGGAAAPPAETLKLVSASACPHHQNDE